MANLLFYIAVFCSILSQCPQFLDTPITRILQATWGVAAIFLFFRNGKAAITPSTRILLGGLFIFFVYLFTCDTFSLNSYFTADLINISIAVMIAIVSYMWWDAYHSSLNLKILAVVILVACFILVYFIYNDSLQTLDLSKKSDVYDAKNSAAQIIMASALVGFVCLHPRKKLYKIALFGAVIGLSVMVFYLRSRATILSWGIAALYLLFTVRNKKVRRIIIAAICAIVLIIVCTPQFYTVVFDQILFGGRAQNDLNDVSSGRLGIIEGLTDYVYKYPIFGIGQKYVDCFPFAMLLQYGLVGFTIVMVYLYKITYMSWKVRKLNDITKCAFILLISYFVNSIFEAQTPFGPGAKCEILWIFYGMMLTYYDKWSREEQYRVQLEKFKNR